MQIKTIVIFIAVTLGVLMGVGGLLYQFGKSAEKPIEDIAGDRTHKIGSGNITLVEFSDFQCPACFSVQAPLKQILDKYGDKVTFVYRHFPLSSIHKNAQLAAQAAEAAHLQGKFFEMHDKLFANQSVWGAMSDPREEFYKYIESIELNKEKFIADLESQGVKDVVANDLLVATRYRLSGTPTFFVNGVKVEFNQIEAKIESLLNAK
jgi:protein-disulfide isomerase